MKIYVAHSRNMDYIKEIYNPLRSDPFFQNYELILPHEKSDISANTREFYKSIDLFIAIVTVPATGLGIELGWAYDDKTKIYCLNKCGSKLNNSIKAVTTNIYEYQDTIDMVEIIKNIVKENQN